MKNIRRRTIAGFNSSAKRVDILSGRQNLYRPVVKIDPATDNKLISDGRWLEDSPTGLKFMLDNTTAKVARFVLEYGDQGYVNASKTHFGAAHLSVGFGVFRVAVGSDHYVTGGAYALGDELTVNATGQVLKAAVGQLVVGIVVEEDQNNQLRYDTVDRQYKMV